MPEPRQPHNRRKSSRQRKPFTFWWPAILIIVLHAFLWLRIPRFGTQIPAPGKIPALPAATLAFHTYPESAFTNSVAVRLLRPHFVSLGHRRDRIETDTAFTARKLPPPPYSSPDYTTGATLAPASETAFIPPPLRIPETTAISATLPLPPPDQRFRITLSPSLQAAAYTFTFPTNALPATTGQLIFEAELDSSGHPIHILRQRPHRRNPAWAAALETALQSGKGNAAARGRIRIEWLSADPTADSLGPIIPTP